MSSLPPATAESARPRSASIGIADVSAVVLVTAALAWSFAPNFASLAQRWERDPNYSFGFLVIPIALAIFWHRRGMLDRALMRPRWWGFLPLALGLGARVLFYDWNEQYLETALIPSVVACAPCHRTGELIVVCADGFIARVPIPV